MNFKRFLINLKKKKILLLGDFFLDQFIYGSSSRLSPEAPVPIINPEKSIFSLGGAGNVLLNLRNIKMNVMPVSLIGLDSNSKMILNILKSRNVSTDFFLKDKDIKGILKQRFVIKNQHVLRVDYEELNFKIINRNINKFKSIIKKLVKEYDLLLVSDYGKGSLNSDLIKYSIDLFNNEKKISIIDPRKKFNNYSAYSSATFITPNLNEVRNLYPNLENIDKEIIVAAKKIIKEYSIKNIIIKRGEKGLTFVNNLNINHLKSVAREVYDVSGAGDTIIACFAAGILGGLTVKESLKLSNRCAAYVISLIGTQPISFDKFSNFFKKL